MNVACYFCTSALTPARCLAATDLAAVVLPERSHISPHDGGHLVVTVRRHRPSRRHLTSAERAHIDALSLLASDALEHVLGTDWFNFQENGNWEMSHMHLHVYGRSRHATDQPFGEALRFPSRTAQQAWVVAELTDGQVEQLRHHILTSPARDELFPADLL